MRNKHGRVGVKKPAHIATQDEIKAKAYERGWHTGYAQGQAEERAERVKDLDFVVNAHRNASALNRARKRLEAIVGAAAEA